MRARERERASTDTHVVEDERVERAAQLDHALRGSVQHAALIGGGDDEDAHVVPLRSADGGKVAPHAGVGVVGGGGGGVGPDEVVVLLAGAEERWSDTPVCIGTP